MSPKSVYILSIPLIIAAFTHLWNPIGQFSPWFGYDEGIYMGRTMNVLSGLGPHLYFDHPYFGQLFLGGLLWIIGYPNLIHPTVSDIHSFEMLWLVPRIVMGVLAVVDTFLVYKVAEKRYSRTVALIASILFAITPLTYFARWILLDSIQLPFLLSSILFALYLGGPSAKYHRHYDLQMSVLSGLFLGLAIFTKIPAFILIPLVAYLILTNSKKNMKILSLWFMPVIIVPSLWPIYAVYTDQFDEWINTISWQAGRSGPDLQDALVYLFTKLDPFLLVFGVIGLAIAALNRDYFLLLWIAPFLCFLYFLGIVQIFHLLPITPAFCIAVSVLVVRITDGISFRHKILTRNKKAMISISLTVVAIIIIFGSINTGILISSNGTSQYFRAAVLVGEYIKDNHYDKNLMLLSNPFYYWMFQYVFYPHIQYRNYDSPPEDQPKTDRVVLMADQNFLSGVNYGREPYEYYFYRYVQNKTGTEIGNESMTNEDWRSYLHVYSYDADSYKSHLLGSFQIDSGLEYDQVLLIPKNMIFR